MTVRMRLRSGIFRALVGISSAVIFTFFFLTVAFDVYTVSVFRSRDKLLTDAINVTDAIAAERVWATIVIGTDGFFGQPYFSNQTERVDMMVSKLRKDRDGARVEYDLLDTAIRAFDESGIVQHRQKVLALNVSGEASLEYYTKLNRYFFNFLRSDSFTNIERSSRQLLALVRLNMLHEFASEERGAISFLLLSGAYRDSSVFTNILRILHNKEASREELELLLENDDEEMYNEIRNEPRHVRATAITDDMRQIVLDAYTKNGSLDVDVLHWFTNMSTVVDMFGGLQTHIFEKHKNVLRGNLAYHTSSFVLAMIGLVLEVIACTLLVYLAWPVLKLFWTMEGKAKKVSSTHSTSSQPESPIIAAMPTPEETRAVKKHNSLQLDISESIETELSSQTLTGDEEQDPESLTTTTTNSKASEIVL